MALVEIGTGPIATGIEGIDESTVKPVRGVINRVAEGIRQTELQGPYTAPYCQLEGVINR